ncbi:MAG: sulfatase-like hydrolase/transferase [Kiritimatiellia bacterium]|jgi:arylsulfatase A-like enzyme|nr:sulfatase-like hydrolase/transferase [Kiritimatiellia bacterium]MDP6847719.1 sulfatase-like hydrolase/transferase [Kiritimatiellia bacterium]
MHKEMKRREFMKAAGISLAAATFLQRSSAFPAGEEDKPDMLLLMPDQMRGDCLSILGHTAVRTPQLDRLAGQGVLFRRAYTTVASCIPARYALLTGLYPQTSGVVGFKAKPFSTPSLPGLLAKAGYSTVLVGRNMHQVPASGDCGYQERILGSTYVNNDEYDSFLRKAAPEAGGIKALVKKVGVTYNHWQARPWPLAEELHPTAWVVARSRKVVEETDGKQPLFLTASFYAPHPPLFPPKKYFDAYLDQKLPSPAHGDWVDWKALSQKGDGNGHRVLLQGEVLCAAQAGYFGLIEQIDNQVASLIRDFKARSEKAGRSWVIVFTTDHGEMLGDHGYFRKCEPYEGSANIPFIISGSPGLGFKPGQRVMQPVCLEDIMPTLLALAGTKSPARVDGVNLLPALRGQRQAIREWLHFEHAPCYSQAQAYHALTDGVHKYIWRPLDGREHLFNLDKDPKEEQDLSKDESHRATLEVWRTRLIQRLANRPEGFSRNGRLIPGRPYPKVNAGTLAS